MKPEDHNTYSEGDEKDFTQYDVSFVEKDISEQEIATADFWEKEKIFQKSIDNRSLDNQYVLYDGPPFATGLPHYGHLLAGGMKDALPRYHTMKGKRVERRFGWDCHGVPVEYIVQKELGLRGKADIEKMGIAKFNEACRGIVLRYVKEWRINQKRFARFVDMENDYKTMQPAYMESVWNVFAQLDKKGLVYQGKKVVAYSTALNTPLSDFEAKLNYKTILDPSITMLFPLVGTPNVNLLVWTTTPWTVPTNICIAINSDIEYVMVSSIHDSQHKLILAKSRVSKYFEESEIKIEPVDTQALIGREYVPMFEVVSPEDRKGCFKIYHSEHVTDADGTGLVHISPAFGEDDYKLGIKHKLPALDFFNANGKFDKELPDYRSDISKKANQLSVLGKSFKEADPYFVVYMKHQKRVFRYRKEEHEYPFCWRTDTPLMYRAVPSWFVEVTKIKDRLIANNKKVNWYPDSVGSKRFHNWLENARDWAVSRNRYWGCPIPIWRNIDNPDDWFVVPSIDELKRLTGKSEITDLHRHNIDGLRIMKEGKTYQRITQVFDCWFESGSMPYAQAHYPFENKEMFEATYPADFIAEGLDQTRGWFYTLMVLSTALFDKPAFKNCMVNGIVLGNDGKKMSKSKGNYAPIDEVFEKYGVDPLRLVLLGSVATQAQSKAVIKKDIKAAAGQIKLMQNIYKYFAINANLLKITPARLTKFNISKLTNPLDQWLIYEIEQFKAKVEKHYDTYDLVKVVSSLYNFLEIFSNWYVRLSRVRFSNLSGDAEDKICVLQCMDYALKAIAQNIAPIAPYVSDILYKNLHGPKQSIHLEDWQSARKVAEYQEAHHQVDIVRKLVRLGYRLREANELRVRQPLATLYLSSDLKPSVGHLSKLIKTELNIKEIKWVANKDGFFNKEIALDNRKLGKKYKARYRQIQKDLAEANYEFKEKTLVIGDVELLEDEYTIKFVPKENVKTAESEQGLWVVMDVVLTPELLREGYQRDLVRKIQDLRKKAGLQKHQKAFVYLSGNLKELLDKELMQKIYKETSTTINFDKQPEMVKLAKSDIEIGDDAYKGCLNIYSRVEGSELVSNTSSGLYIVAPKPEQNEEDESCGQKSAISHRPV